MIIKRKVVITLSILIIMLALSYFFKKHQNFYSEYLPLEYELTSIINENKICLNESDNNLSTWITYDNKNFKLNILINDCLVEKKYANIKQIKEYAIIRNDYKFNVETTNDNFKVEKKIIEKVDE